MEKMAIPRDGMEMSDQATESFQDPGEDAKTSEAELGQFKLWAILRRGALDKYLTGFTYLFWTSNVTNDKCMKWLLQYCVIICAIDDGSALPSLKALC